MPPILLESARPDSFQWVLISAAVLMMLYVSVIRPMRKKKDPLQKQPALSSLAQQRTVEREMSSLLVELHQMARDMNAQLDTRSAKLEVLLREADEKIAALKSASANGDGASAGSSHPPSIGQRADLTPRPAEEIDPRHLEIYSLADQGHSPQEIARRLSRPNGEIELILALRGSSAGGL